MQIKSILVATDLRRKPDPAIQSAVRLSALTGAELYALHCTPPPPLDAEHQAAAEAELAERASSATSAVVVAGLPEDAIPAQAAAVGADVLVLGPRLEAGEAPRRLGSSAARVVSRAGLPCLLANAALAERPRRVLLAVDRSAASARVEEWCVALLPAMAANVTAGAPMSLHVLAVSAYGQPGASTRRVADAQAVASRLAAAAPVDRVTTSHEVHSAGLAHEGILRCAEVFDADLVIMGTHGAGGLAGAVLGSVALEVAKALPRPLLVVPPPR